MLTPKPKNRKAQQVQGQSIQNNNNNKTAANDEATNIQNYLVNANAQLPDVHVTISIQGKKVCTPGNVCNIIGKPKSRKSAVVHSMVASAISGKPVLGIECNLPKHKPQIVLIDTEQAEHDLLNSLKRAKKMADIDEFPAHLRVFKLRELMPNQVKKAIAGLLDTNNQIGMLLIDGGLDLINNMNDVEEAKETVGWLKKILVVHEVSIVMVIHQSKSTNFTIGHFGSFMDRFAQSNIEVIKDDKNGTSTIKSQMMRSDADFKPYDFYYDHRINAYNIDWLADKEVKLNQPADFTFEQHKEHATKVFTTNAVENKIGFNFLVKSIASAYGKSDYMAKKIISHLEQINLLIPTNKDKTEFTILKLR